MPPNPQPLAPIPAATTLDEVVDAIGAIIDWSISVSSRLGYFAALYKRITIAVRTRLVYSGTWASSASWSRKD